MSLITHEFIEELKVLACFDPANTTLGIKVHSDCSVDRQQAAARLHAQGLISAVDGGYLTPFGCTQLEHLHHLLTALRG